MQRRDRPLDDRALSPVIGVVLLVGLAVVSASLVAVLVTGGGFFDDAPSADLVFDEGAPGEVTIAVADARGLTRGGTEIRLEGGGDCGVWGGSGDLRAGDTLTLDASDCTESLEEGDTLQVVGAATLVDTYELRGVAVDPSFDVDITSTNGPVILDDGEGELVVGVDVENQGSETASEAVTVSTSAVDGEGDLGGPHEEELEIDPGSTETVEVAFGDITEDDLGAYTVTAIGSDAVDTADVAVGDYDCEAYSDEIDESSDITIEEDEVVACDFGDDGDRLDITLTVEGTLIGRANVTKINVDNAGTILGDVASEETLEMTEESAIDGEVTGQNGVDLKSNSTVTGNITSDGENVHLRDGSSVNGSITSVAGGKDVFLEADGPSIVNGDIHSNRHIESKGGNTVVGNLTADGTITVGGSGGSGSGTVVGVIEAKESVAVEDDSLVDGDVRQTADGGRGVTIKVNATVSGDVHADDNDVELKDDAVVEGEVFVNDTDSIDCGTDAEIDGVDCESYVDD